MAITLDQQYTVGEKDTTFGQQYDVGEKDTRKAKQRQYSTPSSIVLDIIGSTIQFREKPPVILYTYINRQAGTLERQ